MEHGREAKRDEITTVSIQLPSSGKLEKASAMELSGLRKGVESVGQVG